MKVCYRFCIEHTLTDLSSVRTYESVHKWALSLAIICVSSIQFDWRVGKRRRKTDLKKGFRSENTFFIGSGEILKYVRPLLFIFIPKNLSHLSSPIHIHIKRFDFLIRWKNISHQKLLITFCCLFPTFVFHQDYDATIVFVAMHIKQIQRQIWIAKLFRTKCFIRSKIWFHRDK